MSGRPNCGLPPELDLLPHYWQPEVPNGMLKAAQQAKINVTQKGKKSQPSGVWRKHSVKHRGSICFIICKAL